MRRTLYSALTTVCFASLAACGGGGGGSSSGGGGLTSRPINLSGIPPLTALYSLSSIRTAEYQASGALDAINAAPAYAAGYTGTGIKVAVLDSGIDLSHPEFTGRIASGGQSFISTSSTLQDPVGDGHGTEVSALIAANRNGAGMHGVAYNASILPLKVCDNSACSSTPIVSAIDYAITQNVDVINFSLGFPSSAGAAVYNAFRRATAAGIVVVAAGGNDPASSTPLEPASFASDAGMNGLLVAVGGVNASNIRTGNGALGASGNFVVAPAENLVTADVGGGYTTVTGTSFSTPLVAGAVALLLERFPTLTASQAVSLLLANTTDLGTAGVDNIYGRGLINVEAAMQPAGQLRAGKVAIDAGTLTAASSLAAPLRAALGGITARDDYGRDYAVNLGNRVGALSNIPNPLSRLQTLDAVQAGQQEGGTTLALQEFSNTLGLASGSVGKEDDIAVQRAGFWQQELGALGLVSFSQNLTTQQSWAGKRLLLGEGGSLPFAHLVEEGSAAAWQVLLSGRTTFTAATAIGTPAATPDAEDQTLLHGALTYTLKQASLTANVGTLNEKGTLLGSMGSGTLALADKTTTVYVGLDAAYQITPDVTLAAGYLQGQSDVNAATNSVFSGFTDLNLESWHVGITQQDAVRTGDTLSLTVSQPLTVTSGQVQIADDAYFSLQETAATDVEVNYTLTDSLRTGNLAIAGWWRFTENTAQPAEEAYMVRYRLKF